MAHVVSVLPAPDGWRVSAPGAELSFRSGAEAETAARELGARLAAEGAAAEIRVFLRDGALAGRFLCPPAPPELAPAG